MCNLSRSSVLIACSKWETTLSCIFLTISVASLRSYACAVHVPHLNDFNTDLVEMRKGRSVEDLDRQRMAELETAFEQSAEEEPEQGMEV